MRATSDPGKMPVAKIAVDFLAAGVRAMGAVADSIERRIRDALAPTDLVITDDSSRHAGHAGARAGGESHFTVTIVSAAFEGKSRVARQRLVYDLLKDEFAQGLHALALVTRTPAEAG
ncbi:BolA family protein [Vineibacter terrae]